jgi:hypothetical protein
LGGRNQEDCGLRLTRAKVSEISFQQVSQECWHMPVFPDLGRPKEEDRGLGKKHKTYLKIISKEKCQNILYK